MSPNRGWVMHTIVVVVKVHWRLLLLRAEKVPVRMRGDFWRG